MAVTAGGILQRTGAGGFVPDHAGHRGRSLLLIGCLGTAGHAGIDLVGHGRDAFGGRIGARRPKHGPHEGHHIHDHQPPDRLGVTSRQHHADGPAHRMTDHRRLLEALLADIAGEVLGDRRGDRPFGIVHGGRAGEALDVHPVHPIAVLELVGQPVPDFRRGRQAGDQDDIAQRMFGAIDADVKTAGFESGVLVPMRVRASMGSVSLLGPYGRRQGGGGNNGGGQGEFHQRCLLKGVPGKAQAL